MFLGHFSLGFAAKKWAPRVSLGTLFLAVQFLDLLWPILLLLGVETVAIGGPSPPGLLFSSYPYSHSLVFVLLWSALFAAVYYWRKKNVRVALLLGALVLSHWFLDLVVHVPDLPLYPGGPVVGMGLWRLSWLEIVLEVGLFIVGVVWYLLSTKAKNAWGRYGVWLLVGLLLLVQFSSSFGPAPPSVVAIAWAGNLQWLFVMLAYAVDKYRTPRKG